MDTPLLNSMHIDIGKGESNLKTYPPNPNLSKIISLSFEDKQLGIKSKYPLNWVKLPRYAPLNETIGFVPWGVSKSELRSDSSARPTTTGYGLQ